MRRLCLILLGLTFVSIMKADGEFPYLTFVGSDGTVTSLGVESLEMTVTEDGNLVAVNGVHPDFFGKDVFLDRR